MVENTLQNSNNWWFDMVSSNQIKYNTSSQLEMP
jgi:hypothetical protein